MERVREWQRRSTCSRSVAAGFKLEYQALLSAALQHCKYIYIVYKLFKQVYS